MTAEERALLIETAKEVARLFQERDDMIVGFTAAILDLYRSAFQAGHQTKEDAIGRLRAQRDDLDRKTQAKLGTKMLGSIIATLENDQLDAAKLLREPPSGSA